MTATGERNVCNFVLSLHTLDLRGSQCNWPVISLSKSQQWNLRWPITHAAAKKFGPFNLQTNNFFTPGYEGNFRIWTAFCWVSHHVQINSLFTKIDPCSGSSNWFQFVTYLYMYTLHSLTCVFWWLLAAFEGRVCHFNLFQQLPSKHDGPLIFSKGTCPQFDPLLIWRLLNKQPAVSTTSEILSDARKNKIKNLKS